jgi:hypothetical protein
MKAERRHELQTNSLALWLRWRFPQLLQQYGTRILLAVVFLALAIALIRYRINAPKVAAEDARYRIASAKAIINELRNGAPPGQVSGVTLKLIMDAKDGSDDPLIQAQVYLTLGDYYWALANYPDRPEATTQPEVYRPSLPRDQLLTKAEEAYQQALGAQKDQPDLVAAAHMGLAVVAEQRAFDLDRASPTATATATAPANKYWALATEHYQAVLNSPNAKQILKDEAKWYLEQLPKLQQPLWLVPATQPSATQESNPAATPSTTAPTTRPAK